MKAVRVGAPGEVAVLDVPAPAPVDGEAIVNVELAAVCATDVKLAARGADPPRVPGHEVAGRLSNGTFVGVHPDIGCGKCRSCRAGYGNRCSARVSIGLERDGGFAEQVLVPEGHVVALEGIDTDLGPLIEPLACCLHAVSMLDVREGDLTLVVGAGAMGVLAMWALKNAGASVVMAQRSEPRRSLAEKLGADHTVVPGEDVATVTGENPAVSIVTAPGPEPLTYALEQVAIGGWVHAFAGSPTGAPIDANVVHYRHVRLVGSTGSRVTDYHAAVDLVSSGAIPLHALPSEHIGLEQLPAVLVNGPPAHVLRVLVAPQGGWD